MVPAWPAIHEAIGQLPGGLDQLSYLLLVNANVNRLGLANVMTALRVLDRVSWTWPGGRNSHMTTKCSFTKRRQARPSQQPTAISPRRRWKRGLSTFWLPQHNKLQK